MRVTKKIHQFQSSIKKMHTKEYWLLFFFASRCSLLYTLLSDYCVAYSLPTYRDAARENRATAIGNTPESLAKIKRVVHHHHHHHHLFAQIN